MDDLRLFAEVVAGLATHGDERYLLAFLRLGRHELLGHLDQVRVEAPAEPPVGGHEDDPDPPGVPHGQKGVSPRVHAQGQAAQHVHELDRVGPEVFHPHLGGFELRGRDHVHGPGDLLGLANRGDLSLDVSQCHSLSLFPYVSVTRLEPGAGRRGAAGARHGCHADMQDQPATKIASNSVRASFIFFSRSGLMTFLSSISVMISGYLLFTKLRTSGS